MSITIADGWLSGSLPDDTGKEWPVSQSRQSSTGAQHGSPVNLVLHTTETDSLVHTLKFPSNFQCGAGTIAQHIQLGQSGDAVFTFDRDNIGIEMVGRSNLSLWLPDEPTLGPTVALVAWLHQTGRIKTGLKRPTTDWPTKLDTRGTIIATTGYYRRHTGIFPGTAGVYGHVEVPDNSHWDPGSFDYPKFFARVQAALNQGEDDMTGDDIIEGSRAFRAGKPLPDNASAGFKFGWNQEDRIAKAAQTPLPAATSGITMSDADDRYAPKKHPHTGTFTT